MTDETAITQPLHTAYTRLTGLDVPLTLPRIYAWRCWLDKGYTLGDLELVIAHLKRTISPKAKLLRYLSFTNIVTYHESFAENLAEARALARVPKVDPHREDVLRATHRPVRAETAPARSAEQIMKECEMFKAFRESL